MPHFFISVTQYSLFISLSCFRLPKAAALTDRLQSVGICRSRTCVCIAVRTCSSPVSAGDSFYQVDIILSHPAVNLNVSAALQNTFSDLTNFFFVFLAGTLYFCALYLYLSPCFIAYFQYTKKTELYPAIGKGGTFPNAVLQNKKRGFTLVELIVVLVILAILAALLIPALTGYIDKAKRIRSSRRPECCMRPCKRRCPNCMVLQIGNLIPTPQLANSTGTAIGSNSSNNPMVMI